MALRDSLAQTAIDCLHFASDNPSTTSNEERLSRHAVRGVIQPDSWLLQQCWHALADSGDGIEALSVAALAEMRHPLAPIQAVHRLARESKRYPHLVSLVQAELLHAQERLFGYQLFAEATNQVDYLLFAGASAALIGERLYCFSCLERLDQIPKAWDRVFVQPELRQILAEAIAYSGLTPLTTQLIDKALLYFSDSGAQFLQQVATATRTIVDVSQGPVKQAAVNQELEKRTAHVLNRCVWALQRAVLGSLHSRKVAASVFAQAGHIDDVLEQVRTIATIQDAHRETNAMLNQRGGGGGVNRQESRIEIRSSGTYNDTIGIAEIASAAATERSRAFPVYRAAAAHQSDSSVLRQVSRVSADTDVDFLVYTLKGAVDVLDLSTLTDNRRRILINQLAALGIMSDGWTAAGAAAALLKLGGVPEAIAVVEQIGPADPTRVEGLLALVQGLLEIGDIQGAQTQSIAALSWADGIVERSPARSLRRGLATTYVEHNLPEIALQILDSDAPGGGEWRHTVYRFLTGRWFGDEYTDEQLQTDRLRLAANLKQVTLSQQVEANDALTGNGQGVHENAPSPTHSPTALNQFPISRLDVPLPAHVDKLVRELSGWAANLLDGEALISFYLNNLLLPLLQAGKFRYAWGLLPHIRDALLHLQSNKMAVRTTQVCQPLAAQIAAAAQQENDEIAVSMGSFFIDFIVELWQTCSARGVWPTIYAIDGTLSSIITLFGPETIVEIAQSTSEEGVLWGSS